jgi:ATP-dependent RNA helicase DDX3X
MMFSATFPPTVQKMAGDFMHDYLFITVGRVGAASETITQYLFYAQDGPQKTRALNQKYREYAPPEGQLTVIFVETKRRADEIELELWKEGLKVCAIHGDRDQKQREDALEAFKSGENPILVATDVAARGLDISNVGLVINYDMPKQMDDYVHRIGRTGRAGKRGVAIGFVNDKCRYCNELSELLQQAKQQVPEWLAHVARDNLDNYYANKGKGKGGYNGGFGGQDVRKLAEKPSKVEKVEEKKEVAKAAPKPPERPKSPPREVPDAWDDSD